MKKTIVPALFMIAIALMVSCKKERTCNCTVTKTGTSTTTANIVFGLDSVALPFPVPPIPLGSIGMDTTFTSPFSETYTENMVMDDVTKKTAKSNCFNYKVPYNESVNNIVPNFTLNTTNKGEKSYSCELD